MARSRERCVLFAPPGAALAGRPVFGLQLVERTVLAFLRAGVRDFAIAGDPEVAAQVAAILAAGRCREARVRLLAPHESLLPLLEGDEARFVVRTDTLYDRRLIARFVEETRRAPAAVVAVDFRADALAAQDGAPRTASCRPPPPD